MACLRDIQFKVFVCVCVWMRVGCVVHTGYDSAWGGVGAVSPARFVTPQYDSSCATAQCIAINTTSPPHTAHSDPGASPQYHGGPERGASAAAAAGVYPVRGALLRTEGPQSLREAAPLIARAASPIPPPSDDDECAPCRGGRGRGGVGFIHSTTDLSRFYLGCGFLWAYFICRALKNTTPCAHYISFILKCAMVLVSWFRGVDFFLTIFLPLDPVEVHPPVLSRRAPSWILFNIGSIKENQTDASSLESDG